MSAGGEAAGETGVLSGRDGTVGETGVLVGRADGVLSAGSSTGRAGLVGSSIAAGRAGSSTARALYTSSALPSSSGRPLVDMSIAAAAASSLARRRRKRNAAMISAMITIGIAVARAMVVVFVWLPPLSVAWPDESVAISVVEVAGVERDTESPGDGSVLVEAGLAPDDVVVMLNSARLFHNTGIAGAQISVNTPTRTTVPSV